LEHRYILKNGFFKKISPGRRIALFLDHDGTLVPIQKDPSGCRLPDNVKEALESLADSNRCYLTILSGRSLPDIKKMVGIANICYGGNHGLIIYGRNIRFIHPKALSAKPSVDKAVRRLNKEIEGIAGAWIEKKRYTATLHFRWVENKDVSLVKKAFDRVLSKFSGDRRLTIIKGKKVLELAPDASWNKGSAALYILKKLKDKYLPVYIGDDWTDETAFRALKKKGVTIRVGKSAKTAANYYLKNQREALEFLEKLREIIA